MRRLKHGRYLESCFWRFFSQFCAVAAYGVIAAAGVFHPSGIFAPKLAAAAELPHRESVFSGIIAFFEALSRDC